MSTLGTVIELYREIGNDGLFPEKYMRDNRILILAYFVFFMKRFLYDFLICNHEHTIYKLWARDNNNKPIIGLLTRQPVGYSRPDDDFSTPESHRHWDIDQHDNSFGVMFSRQACRDIYKYGIKHFGYYNPRPFKDLIKERGLLKALKEFIRCTRQPYQMAAIGLVGYGVCFPVAYLHLLIVILIEVFKGASSGKALLLLFSDNAIGLGKPLSYLFRILMRLKYGKNYIYEIASTTFVRSNPLLIDLCYHTCYRR